MSVLKYVNVFQGNGEINLPEPKGIAATWRFLKAQCGNTSPWAAYPFGYITCGAYTGGYPTGYGNHRSNTCGPVQKFDAKLQGFAHFQQSGTGYINVFYNYALVTPLYGGLGTAANSIADEYAAPGVYACTMKESKIKARLTVSDKAAYHRYEFDKSGIVQIDFSAAGLSPKADERAGAAHIDKAEMHIENDCVLSAIQAFGETIYFAVKCRDAKNIYLWKNYKKSTDAYFRHNGEDGTFGCAFDVENIGEVKLAASRKSFDDALKKLNCDDLPFDEIAKRTAAAWEEYLSAIEIETASEELKEIFYSNLYHSFIKPCNWEGEYTDFSTMWDLYKTQLPLVFSLFKKERDDIAESLLKIIEEKGRSPINVNIAANNDIPTQARMLVEYSLADAFYRNADINAERVLNAAYTDLKHNSDVFDINKLDRFTHLLDVSGACNAMCGVAQAAGNEKMRREFEKHVCSWETAYDRETGLLSEKSEYYEGDNRNYSFRFLNNMDKRIEIAGGRERFLTLLDDFFGFTRKPVSQLTKPEENAFLDGVHSFEGFNNEPDMETPYAYTFAKKHSRVCEVVRAGLKYMFTVGRGGLPGNNDSGGLTSCYVWNAIGLFPVAGRDLMLIGSPAADKVRIRLSSDKEFTVLAHSNSEENIYVEKAFLNGKELEEKMFSVRELMQGGVLELYMTNKS